MSHGLLSRSWPVAILAMLACDGPKIDRARADAQTIATRRFVRPADEGELLPDRRGAAVGWRSVAVGPRQGPVGRGVHDSLPAVDDRGRYQRRSRPKRITIDDIEASAVGTPALSRAPSPPEPPFVRTPDPPNVVERVATKSAACAACDRTRLGCLVAVQGGHLIAGSEDFTDPIEASKSECVFAYVACTADVLEKSGVKCR